MKAKRPGKDDRLFAKFSLDFADHPKIYTLSDAAFRAIIEMTLYSRAQMSDGKLKAKYAEKRWGTEVLAELCSNDDERPSLYPANDGADYIIHDFAKHQETRAEIEQSRSTHAENGRRGGLAKAANRRQSADPLPPASEPLAKGTATAVPPAKQEGGEPLPETETETETTLPSEGGAGEPAPTTSPKTSKAEPLREFRLNKDLRAWAASELSALANLSEDRARTLVDAETRQFVDYWRSESGPRSRKKDWVAAWRVWMRRSNLNPGSPSAIRRPSGPVEKPAPKRNRIRAGENPYA